MGREQDLKAKKHNYVMSFIKKVFRGEFDDSVHQQFIRYGKGDYKGRFPLSLWKTKRVKLRTSFEFANDIVLLCAKMGSCKVSGEVVSKDDISAILSENNIEGNTQSKKAGRIFLTELPSQDLNEEQLTKLVEASTFALLDITGEGFTLKSKKKLPKPGKNENKIDDKFCQLEADEKYFSRIKDGFFWDMPEGKKIMVKHQVLIDSIKAPEGEKDFAKIRELAKRVGKIIRIADIDGTEKRSEVSFEA